MLDMQYDIVSSTFLSVVEQLTFMFGEPIEKSEMKVVGMPFTLARISFVGDLEGTVSAVVPTEILVEIAANILGLEPEDVSAESMAPDAFGEMLNVICGHVIMDLAGPDANFKLGSPKIESVDAAFLGGLQDDPDFQGFLLDDHPVFLGLATG